MADGDVAGERVEVALLEDPRDEPEVLGDGDGVAVADRDAGRLLAAVLQRVQAEVGEAGDVLARRVHAEDAAGLFGTVGTVEGPSQGSTRTGSWRSGNAMRRCPRGRVGRLTRVG